MGRREAIDAWEALEILCTLKPLSDTLDEAMDSAGRHGGFGRGSSLLGRRWTFDVAIRHRRTRVVEAVLAADGLPIAGLDHHQRATRDGTPAGYHWDLHPPLVSAKCRVWLPDQPETVEAAVTIACEGLSIVLDVRQDDLLRRR